MRHATLPLLCAAIASVPVPSIATASAPADTGVPVPAALRGVWAARIGPIRESCTAEADGFKWSFTADRERFHYWEARARPTRVRQTGPNRYVIDLVKTGEGSTWKERRTYTLVDGTSTLVVDVPLPEMKLRDSRFERCPDRPVAAHR